MSQFIVKVTDEDLNNNIRFDEAVNLHRYHDRFQKLYERLEGTEYLGHQRKFFLLISQICEYLADDIENYRAYFEGDSFHLWDPMYDTRLKLIFCWVKYVCEWPYYLLRTQTPGWIWAFCKDLNSATSVLWPEATFDWDI